MEVNDEEPVPVNVVFVEGARDGCAHGLATDADVSAIDTATPRPPPRPRSRADFFPFDPRACAPPNGLPLFQLAGGRRGWRRREILARRRGVALALVLGARCFIMAIHTTALEPRTSQPPAITIFRHFEEGGGPKTGGSWHSSGKAGGGEGCRRAFLSEGHGFGNEERWVRTSWCMTYFPSSLWVPVEGDGRGPSVCTAGTLKVLADKCTGTRLFVTVIGFCVKVHISALGWLFSERRLRALLMANFSKNKWGLSFYLFIYLTGKYPLVTTKHIAKYLSKKQSVIINL